MCQYNGKCDTVTSDIALAWSFGPDTTKRFAHGTVSTVYVKLVYVMVRIRYQLDEYCHIRSSQSVDDGR